jgi:uncharacterized iron-regulated membrane protein
MGRGLAYVRRVLFWMHLSTGVLIGILVLYFSITGALLAYERPILRAADEHTYSVDPDRQQSPRLALDALVAPAAAALPSPIEMVTTHQDPHAPVEIQTANRNVYFVDPYSGKIDGPESPRLRSFFFQVTALHRWFGLSNAHHTAAIAVKGAAALLLLFMLLSGALLWIPGYWTRTSLAVGIVPRIGKHARIRNLNWHKVTGFWLGLPLTIIVLTGVIMAYPWANAQLFRLAGSPLPVRNGEGANPRRHAPGGPTLPSHLDQAFAQATNAVQGWQTASLRLPAGGRGLTFSVDRSEGGHPEKREQVLIDTTTLRVLHQEPFAALSRGQQWRSWVRFVHTGEAGGWWGETLAVLTACGAMVLSLTGVALAWNRWRRWRNRASRRTLPADRVAVDA